MSRFPNYLLFTLLTCCFTLVFSSCDDEARFEETTIEITTEDEMPILLEAALPPPDETTEEARNRCFSFVFPMEIILRNGTVITVQDMIGLRIAAARLRNEGLRANFVYPFDVVLADETTITVTTFRDFRRVQASCADREPCFTYIYPIDITINRRTITINSNVEWLRAVAAAGRGADVSINFPIQVNPNGTDTILTIERLAGLERLRYACGHQNEEDDRDPSPCFTYNYPIDLIIGDQTVAVSSREDWYDVIRRVGRDVAISVGFPVTVTITESGEEITVAAREEWINVREACN